MTSTIVSPMFLFTLEEKIRPGYLEEYKDLTKKWINLIRELKVGIGFSAFGSEDGYMDFNQRISGPCDFGAKLEAWGRVQEALLATEWGKKRLTTVEWSRYSVWQRSAELSYQPLHPDPDPKHLTYFIWKDVRVRAEKEKEFLDTGREIRAFLEEKNIERGYNVFRNLIGHEGPLYTIVFAGKDSDEANEYLKMTGKNLGLALLPFLPGITEAVEHTTDFQGRAMPDVSLPGK